MWVHISVIVIVRYNRSLFQWFLCVFCGGAGSCLQWHNSEVFSWQKSSVIDMFLANEHAEIFACVLLRNKSHFKELINCNNHHCFQNDVLENINFIFLFETFLSTGKNLNYYYFLKLLSCQLQEILLLYTVVFWLSDLLIDFQKSKIC